MQILSFKEFEKRYDVNFRAKSGDPDFLGAGGFGNVYKGHCHDRHFDVAIKRSEVGKHLLDEVEKGELMPNHPNIARYIEGFRVDSESGDFDIAVLQYYPKGNLNQLIEKEKLTEPQLDRILKGILTGLDILHEGIVDKKTNQNIHFIHRDLKPQNILIAEHKGIYTPLITDFGVSKLLKDDDFLSSGKFINSSGLGTVAYKAPEQIQNSVAKSNLDLWAFGVMMFKVLTGEVPFKKNSSSYNHTTVGMEVLNAIISKDLEEIFSKVKNKPERYQQLIRRCLVRDINVRAQTAKELIDILDEIPVRLQKAMQWIQEEEFEEAKSEFEAVLHLRENHTEGKKGLELCQKGLDKLAQIKLHLQLASQHYESTNYVDASKAFNQVLALKPEHVLAIEGLAKSQDALAKVQKVAKDLESAKDLFRNKHYSEARELFEGILALDSNHIMARSELKKCDQAILEHNKQLQIENYLKLANKHYESKNYDEASKAFQQVFALDPEHILANQGLSKSQNALAKELKVAKDLQNAENLFRNKRYSEARELFEGILAMDSSHIFARSELKKCNEAILEQNKQLQIENYLKLANKHYESKNYDEASKVFQQVFALEPEHILANQGLSKSQNALAKELKVAKDLQNAENLFRKKCYSDARELLQGILAMDANHNVARSELKKCNQAILEQDKQLQIEKHLELANKHYEAKNYEEASKIFKQVLVLDPEHPSATESYVHIQKELVKKAKVAKAWSEAKTHLENKSYTEAIAVFYRILKVEPDNNAARFELDKCKKAQKEITQPTGQQDEERTDNFDEKVVQPPSVEPLILVSRRFPSVYYIYAGLVVLTTFTLISIFGNTATSTEPPPKKREIKAVVIEQAIRSATIRSAQSKQADSLFALGKSKLDTADKQVAFAIMKKAVDLKPSLKPLAVTAFTKKADEMAKLIPEVSAKYRKLSEQF